MQRRFFSVFVVFRQKFVCGADGVAFKMICLRDVEIVKPAVCVRQETVSEISLAPYVTK